MKNRIFLLLLCVFAVSVMTADDSLYFPEGSRWTNASSEASYIIQGDTLVNGKKYHKVIDKNKDRQKLVALKREEGKKIYVRFEGTDTDVLLYDFGLKVGDSIVLQTDQCNGPCSIIHVERIDTVTLLDGRKAKCFFYDSRMWDVEFVGCETGLFGPIYMPVIPTMYSSDSYSYCFSINGKPIFETYPGICKSCGFTDKLPSLCDEWNVWYESFQSFGPINYNAVIKYRLATDTMINGQRYVQLQLASDNSPYMEGALREGSNRDIYYIPSRSTHEYLLYAFNAQVGDTITNLYVGAMGKEEGYQAVVRAISDSNPRIFTVGVNTDEYTEYSIKWIEGVGSPETPCGLAVVPPSPADVGTFSLLCAYKNGEQVYVSEMGEQYNCGEDAPDAMFPPETRWNYMHTEMYGGPDDNYVFTLQPMDTIISNTRYQQIGSFLFRSKGAKVWCAVDSMGTFVERLVYDFDLQVGDSIRAICYYDEESYAKVTSVEQTYLADGRYARRISYDGFRPDDIEHIGSIEGILTPLNLPIPTCGCSDLFQCCTKSDYLLYEVAQGACDTFLPKEQPTDTIPLFIKDGPGSSTVEPVDPNLIYATLTKDVLSVYAKEKTEISFVLYKAPKTNQVPATKRTMKSASFTGSLSTTLTESGTYTMELTSPAWGYTVFGTFEYNQVPQAIENTSANAPSATKILRDGQLLLMYQEQMFNVQGQRIK